MRDQAFDQATKEIIIAWENEVSIRLENWWDTNQLYINYTWPHAITRMLIDLKYIRMK
jgi:hypothetical protein